MSNIKSIEIVGQAPYNLVENGDEFLKGALAQMVMPDWGFGIEFSSGCVWEDLPNGGRLAKYNFEISGEEAVRWEYLELLVDSLRKAGASIALNRAQDIECGVDGWVEIIKLDR